MKFSHFNILLFSLSLNILESEQSNCNSPKHTSNSKTTKTYRSLCECDIYTSIYDNDSEMKKVMQDFYRQTLQRFEEYNERMQEKRKNCKEQSDKDIQKIILKDTIEKQMAENFSLLETKIDTNDIPTCVCEKSLAEKTEKFCHNCGYGLGSVVTNIGLLGGIGIYGWKIAALAAAKEFAEKAGAAEGSAQGAAAGAAELIAGLKRVFFINDLNGKPLQSLFTAKTYTDVLKFSNAIHKQYVELCTMDGTNTSHSMCNIYYTLDLAPKPGGFFVPEESIIATEVNKTLEAAKDAAALKAADITTKQTAAIETAKKSAIDATYASCNTAIIASIVAIVVIVLLMVIIYLILRYRRKKRMKKKLQYIKLLKE